MGFITKGPFCRQRVGMLVLWPSRTPSTCREACVRDTNGRSIGVVAMRARAIDDDAVRRARVCVRVERVIVRARAVWGTVRAIARRRSTRDARVMGRRARRETEETIAVMTRVLVHMIGDGIRARARARLVSIRRERAPWISRRDEDAVIGDGTISR
jgi:hypothetical protein